MDAPGCLLKASWHAEEQFNYSVGNAGRAVLTLLLLLLLLR
jgi:hypothetical protein